MTATESLSTQASFDLIRSRFSDPNFLNCQGLGNEVPFYVYAYDTKRENEVRARTEQLVESSRRGDLPARIVHFDLWDIFCSICAYYEIFDDLERMEAQQGDEALLQHIQELAMPEDYVNAMSEQFERAYGAPTPGRDVLLITGVGKAYPFVRAHDILENAQPVFSQIPVALFYPGIYDGQSLRLFGSVQDGNYYRAFSLL